METIVKIMKNQWKLMDLPMIKKMTKYAKRMRYPYPPIQGHLVYSHLIMYIYYVIYTAHMYMCV